MNRKQRHLDRYDTEERIVVKPAQDFVMNRMYYGVIWDRAWYLVSSDRVLRSPGQCRRTGIDVAPGLIRASGFSAPGLVAYLKGQTISAVDIYRAVHSYISGYRDLSSECEASLLALWTMGTYVHRVFQYYPYLWVPGSGAAPLLRILQPIVFAGAIPTRRELTTLYRLTDSAATLLIGEPLWLHKASSSALILEAGYRKNVTLTRYDAVRGQFHMRQYSLYSPKILAGDAVAWECFCDKSIPVGLDRKERDTLCPILESRQARKRQEQIVDDLHIFGLCYAAELAKRYNHLECIAGTEGALHREPDLWQPILVLANLIDRQTGTTQVTRGMVELSARDLGSMKILNASAWAERSTIKETQTYE